MRENRTYGLTRGRSKSVLFLLPFYSTFSAPLCVTTLEAMTQSCAGFSQSFAERLGKPQRSFALQLERLRRVSQREVGIILCSSPTELSIYYLNLALTF